MTLWQSSGHKFLEFTTENSLRLVCEVQLKCGILFFFVLIAIVLRQSKWQPETRSRGEERNQDNILRVTFL